MAADGDTIAVTVANTCTIHLFEPSGDARLVIRTDGLVDPDECFFGASLAVGGGRVAVVGVKSGILVFDAERGTFLRTIRPPGAFEEAGPRVALVGRTLFVGVSGFALFTDGPSRLLAFDAATGRRHWRSGAPGGSKRFGSSVAADGRWLVVGSWQDARGREAVALLDARTGRARRVYRSRRRRSDFGFAVGIRGTRVLIGAPDFERGRGRAYLFARRSGVRLATYRPATSSAAGGAGFAVATSSRWARRTTAPAPSASSRRPSSRVRAYSGSSPKCARVMRSFRYSSVPRSSTMSPPVS
ncbi:MAG TPA: PQQ-binding-like beta-propeller repeat protein [Candidatus Binatia bacterium]|nr:PQQ-binding-like beta-propeller repeat protein [Candidatus Binatia bacterium]